MSHSESILNLTQDGDGVVHLHANKAGLEGLIERLQRLSAAIDDGICEHDHLMTEEWGGDGLSSKNGIVAEGHQLVQHLKIFGWTEDWAVKHGFC